MKFYVIQHDGEQMSEDAVYLSAKRAMKVLDGLARAGYDIAHYSVQEYEGWATCMRWKWVEGAKSHEV